MAATVIHRRKIESTSPVRRYVMGAVFLIIAAISYLIFFRSVAADQLTTFVMTPGGITRGVVGDWVMNSRGALLVVSLVTAFAGAYQLARGFGRFTNGMLGVVMGFFVFGFLVWAASGKSLNLGGMLGNALQLSVPIVLGAFSGVICERAGVVNIAIEGMMLMAAMVGAFTGSVTQSAWLGLLGAVLASMLLAAVHAVLSIKYKINQIISSFYEW